MGFHAFAIQQIVVLFTLAGRQSLNSAEKNPWFQRPVDLNETRWIEGQFCVWDDDEELRMWIPVCPVCKRGPITKGQIYCGEEYGVSNCVSGVAD